MTRKQIDGMREVRLWIGQVIVPVTALIMVTCPEARQATKEKMHNAKESIKKKFKRES